MNSSSSLIKFRLSVMMFLQFFIWGAYLVPLGKYLQAIFPANTAITGQAYGTNALAAIVSPIFVGLLADKFFAPQRVMAFLHLLGGGLLLWLANIDNASSFYWILLAYSLCYMPTLAMANTIAFNHLAHPEKQFPAIRLWGTIGWIIAGVFVGSLLPLILQKNDIGSTAIPLYLSGFASLLLGIYSFSFGAKTAQSQEASLGLLWQAMKGQRNLLFFLASSFFLCIPLAFYYGWTNRYLSESGITSSETKMALGQVSEIFFMLLLPFFLSRFRLKTILLVGMIAWLLRYGIFALGTGPSLLILAILLHGICYDFFFVTGYLYMDSQVPNKIRSLAQSLLTVATYGLGMLVGNYLGVWAEGRFSSSAGLDWSKFWQVPLFLVAFSVLFFGISFRDNRKLNKS